MIKEKLEKALQIYFNRLKKSGDKVQTWHDLYSTNLQVYFSEENSIDNYAAIKYAGIEVNINGRIAVDFDDFITGEIDLEKWVDVVLDVITNEKYSSETFPKFSIDYFLISNVPVQDKNKVEQDNTSEELRSLKENGMFNEGQLSVYEKLFTGNSITISKD